jgi:hypothetical protein
MIGVSELALALALAVAAVSRDPLVTDVAISIGREPMMCYRCRGEACDDLLFALAERLEAITGRPTAVEKSDDGRVCIKVLDAHL